MICDECKLICPAKYPPENVAMDRACKALSAYCRSKGIAPGDPMSWIRGYLSSD